MRAARKSGESDMIDGLFGGRRNVKCPYNDHCINDLDIVDVNDESELKSRVAANKYISCVVRVLILRPLVTLYGEMINCTVGKGVLIAGFNVCPEIRGWGFRHMQSIPTALKFGRDFKRVDVSLVTIMNEPQVSCQTCPLKLCSQKGSQHQNVGEII